MPKMGTSQTMPTTAPAPPAWREENRGDQFCSSPMRRSTVTASVIRAGVRIRDVGDDLCGSVVISHPPGWRHWRTSLKVILYRTPKLEPRLPLWFIVVTV